MARNCDKLKAYVNSQLITFSVTYTQWVTQEYSRGGLIRKAERINKSFRSFDGSLSVDPKTQNISQHLVILFKRLCVSIKSLFYEPEQKVSARRSLCITRDMNQYFSRFPRQVVRGHSRSLRAHKIRQLRIHEYPLKTT